MNIIENRYTNKPWLSSVGNGGLFEGAPETTFESRKMANESKIEIVTGDDDNLDSDSKKKGYTPNRPSDSQGDLLDAQQEANTWLDDYDGARKLNYCQYFI